MAGQEFSCERDGARVGEVRLMWLYLVQHGEATSEEEDPERPLTERGVVDVHRVARKAAEAGIVTAVRVVHSGKTRARQTAEAWGQALGVPVDQGQDLSPRCGRVDLGDAWPPRQKTSCWSATCPNWPSWPASCSLATRARSLPSSRADWSASSRLTAAGQCHLSSHPPLSNESQRRRKALRRAGRRPVRRLTRKRARLWVTGSCRWSGAGVVGVDPERVRGRGPGVTVEGRDVGDDAGEFEVGELAPSPAGRADGWGPVAGAGGDDGALAVAGGTGLVAGDAAR